MSGLPSLRALLLCVSLALALLLPVHAQAATGPVLELDASSRIALWPHVMLWRDPEGTASPERVLAEPQAMARPQGTPGNLGRTLDAVWLRLDVHVPGDQVLERVLTIDYASLNEVDVYLADRGRIRLHHAMGNARAYSERPLPSRVVASPLKLEPGDHVLLVRVKTHSSVVLPMFLYRPEAYHAYESLGQVAQGLVHGLALCMLLYSVLHWLSLRDGVFRDYALLLSGNLLFTLSYFGLGAQYLWPDWPHWSTHVAPMAVMLAVAAGANFTRKALVVVELGWGLETTMRATTAAAIVSLALSLCGLLSYPQMQTIAAILGIISTAGALPAGWLRARRGEPMAAYMLVGWTFYLIGAALTALLLRGLIEPSPWVLYAYPASMLVEMSAWTAALGLRVQHIHRSADRVRMESETLRTLADTDSLTGLPNRRGLARRLTGALGGRSAGSLVAVYVMDLDGFKPVNDQHGHDAGDNLLVAVGQRLQAQLRGSDVVARVGGDEFVVLAHGLVDEGGAQLLGDKILSAFDAPFAVAGCRFQLGITIGYVLAPTDGDDPKLLLRLADAAMYAGKNSGRRRVVRAAASHLQSSASTPVAQGTASTSAA